ncbi:hypothetical protein VP01_761g5 [Puccinia sorghi]|uniref:Uncharacterized protein n=1 Tax=Puccinia sorghi TaxID=27349 RepID=A0A0L6UBT8_9BASI|nr:hypothetical protein VP01_761g5 [Puccinia sorghi]
MGMAVRGFWMRGPHGSQQRCWQMWPLKLESCFNASFRVESGFQKKITSSQQTFNFSKKKKKKKKSINITNKKKIPKLCKCVRICFCPCPLEPGIVRTHAYPLSSITPFMLVYSTRYGLLHVNNIIIIPSTITTGILASPGAGWPPDHAEEKPEDWLSKSHFTRTDHTFDIFQLHLEKKKRKTKKEMNNSKMNTLLVLIPLAVLFLLLAISHIRIGEALFTKEPITDRLNFSNTTISIHNITQQLTLTIHTSISLKRRLPFISSTGQVAVIYSPHPIDLVYHSRHLLVQAQLTKPVILPLTPSTSPRSSSSTEISLRVHFPSPSFLPVLLQQKSLNISLHVHQLDLRLTHRHLPGWLKNLARISLSDLKLPLTIPSEHFFSRTRSMGFKTRLVERK